MGIIQRMSKQARKPLKWIGSAKRDLDSMPEDVKDLFGHAIDLAQAGGKHQDAKALSGFGSAGVLEVVEDFRSDTYRAVYTVKFAGWVYVLHCFQKKSKSGIKTPKEDMDMINARLKAAKQDFENWQKQQGAR
ncbi:MAG: type II toxin-antitoxin system RelE/ParE family toxin [Sulfuritalea sp.]|jgi:phage-related protein|nr:type II toxin-antitoxin system RelE/ParE family toxin [Sulfuritalea sp.]